MDLISTTLIFLGVSSAIIYCYEKCECSSYHNIYRYAVVTIFSLSALSCSDDTSIESQATESKSLKIESKARNIDKNKLMYLARDCIIKDVAGANIEFNTTALPVENDFTADDVCGYAGIVADKDYVETKNLLGVFCETADKLAEELGYGSYVEAENNIAASNHPSKNSALGKLRMCKSRKSRMSAIKSISNANSLSIFSIGYINHGGSTCKAFLTLKRSQKGSTIYNLIGTELCSIVDTRNDEFIKLYFDPISRPNSQPLSKFIEKYFMYTGAMPNIISTEDGKTYPF